MNIVRQALIEAYSYKFSETQANGQHMTHATLARIVAHRGASGDAPENTLAALQLAADMGARCVEIDVSISADKVPFVHHDHTLGRCTTGEGRLCEHSAEQLDKLTAGKNMMGFDAEPLPRLSAVIELLVRNNLGLNLEIKPVDGLEEATVTAICNEVDKSWPAHLPLVFSSFSHQSLGIARTLCPQVARAPLVGAVPANWQRLMDKYEGQNLHCAHNKLKHAAARAVIEAGYGLYCYTVNDAPRAQVLFDWGVHGIFTDYPTLFENLNVS